VNSSDLRVRTEPSRDGEQTAVAYTKGTNAACVVGLHWNRLLWPCANNDSMAAHKYTPGITLLVPMTPHCWAAQ